MSVLVVLIYSLGAPSFDSRIVEDKTFGLKNKSKSKKVQQYVNEVKKVSSGDWALFLLRDCVGSPPLNDMAEYGLEDGQV